MANKHYNVDEEVEVVLQLKIKVKSISNYQPLTDSQIEEHVSDFKENINKYLLDKLSGECQNVEVTDGVDYWNFEILSL